MIDSMAIKDNSAIIRHKIKVCVILPYISSGQSAVQLRSAALKNHAALKGDRKTKKEKGIKQNSELTKE